MSVFEIPDGDIDPAEDYSTGRMSDIPHLGIAYSVQIKRVQARVTRLTLLG